MEKILLLLFIPAILFLTGCSENSFIPDGSDAGGQGDNFTFYEDSSMAEEITRASPGEASDPFEIKKAWLSEEDGKKLMHIHVSQEQGCRESYPEKFEVIWDGIMLMIYPPRIGFYLAFNADSCPSLEPNVEETITLDLYDLFGGKDLVDPAEFTVINASDSSSKETPHSERE